MISDSKKAAEAAFELLRADAAASGVRLRARFGRLDDPEWSFVEIWSEDDNRRDQRRDQRGPVPRSDDPVDQLDFLGEDLVQDMMIWRLWRAWPGCRQHPAPMELDLSHKPPLWRCPGSDEHQVPVGQLANGPEWLLP